MKRITLLAAAELDLDEAFNWYENQKAGLGESFLGSFQEAATRAADRPGMYPITVGEMRRALISRFPYSVFYSAREGELLIHAVFHVRRDPAQLWSRS